MKVGIDLRCLNYAKYTGINAYCIHILGCLSNMQSTPNTEIKFIGIGLKKTRLLELQTEFELFNSLFSSHRTLEEYYGFDLKNTKLLELISCIQIYNNNTLDLEYIEKFDYIIQPQPRLIKLNKDTKLISFFHDVYDLIENKLRLNKILNNKKSWKLITDRCVQIVTNSRSTSIDTIKLLAVEDKKIKLIYPGTPDLDSFRNKSGLTKNRHPDLVFGSPTTKTKSVNKSTSTNCSIGLEGESLSLNTHTGVVNPFQTMEKKPYVLAISGIEPRKNWHNLLLAFKDLQSNNNYKTKLILAGTIVDQKYYKYLLKLIQKHKIENVDWIIEPKESLKNNLISDCKFLVYPSFYEGFGFPILEAQKYKKNILTSKNSSLLEINLNHIFINPNNYKSIANGILLLEKSEFVQSKIEFNWDELQKYVHNLFITCR